MEKQKFIGENIKTHLQKKNAQTPQSYYENRQKLAEQKNEKLTGKKFDLKKATQELSKLKKTNWEIKSAKDNFFLAINKFLKQPNTYFYNPPQLIGYRRNSFAFHILKHLESNGLNTGMFNIGDQLTLEGGKTPQITFNFTNSKKTVIFDLKTLKFKNKSDIPKRNQSLAEKHKTARQNINEHAKSLLASLKKGTLYNTMNLLGITYNHQNLKKLYTQAKKELGPKATGSKSEIVLQFLKQKYGTQLKKLAKQAHKPKNQSTPVPAKPTPPKPAPPPQKKAPTSHSPKRWPKAWPNALLRDANKLATTPKTQQQAYETYQYILRNPQKLSPKQLKAARKSLSNLSRSMVSKGEKMLNEMNKKMPTLGSSNLSMQYLKLLKTHINATNRPTVAAARTHILKNLDKLVKKQKLKRYIISQSNIATLAIQEMSEPDPRKKQYLHLQMIDRMTGDPTKLKGRKKDAILRMYQSTLQQHPTFQNQLQSALKNPQNIIKANNLAQEAENNYTDRHKEKPPSDFYDKAQARALYFLALKNTVQNPTLFAQSKTDSQADALTQIHLILIGRLTQSHLAILNKKTPQKAEKAPTSLTTPELFTIEKSEKLIKETKYAQAKDHLETILHLRTNLSSTDRKKAEKLLDNINEKYSKQILSQRKEKYKNPKHPALKELNRSIYLLEKGKIGPAIHNLNWIAKNHPAETMKNIARKYLRITNIKILKKFKSIADGMKSAAAKKVFWRRWSGLSSLEAGYEQDYAKLADRFIRILRTNKAYSIPTAKDHILSKRTWGSIGLRFYLSRNRSAMEQFYGAATSSEDSTTQLHFKYLLAKRLSGSLTDVTSFSQAQNLYLSILANNETIKTQFIDYTKKHLQNSKPKSPAYHKLDLSLKPRKPPSHS